MSVAAGSAEPLRFLEMSYKGGDKVNNKITYQIPLHTYRLYDFLLLIVHKYIWYILGHPACCASWQGCNFWYWWNFSEALLQDGQDASWYGWRSHCYCNTKGSGWTGPACEYGCTRSIDRKYARNLCTDFLYSKISLWCKTALLLTYLLSFILKHE